MDPKCKELESWAVKGQRNFASMSVDLTYSNPDYIQAYVREELTWDETPLMSVHLTPEIIVRGSRSELIDFFLTAVTSVATVTETPDQ